MAQNDATLAALIGSRICHDLISPIGAINNGLELLGMTMKDSGPELDLISESVRNASARIRFFRLAFGGGGDQQLGRGEIAGVLDDFTHGGRVSISYHPTGAYSRTEMRMIFLAILSIESALAYGGEISVDETNNSWTLIGRGEKLNVDQTHWNLLASPASEITIPPSHVQFAMLPIVASEAGRRTIVAIDETTVRISF
ncbi:MAG: histidine phosphotransferase family protein [Pseudomonadota bacterium]